MRRKKNSIKRILELIKADKKKCLRKKKPKVRRLFGISDMGFFRKKVESSNYLPNIRKYSSATKIVDALALMAGIKYIVPVMLNFFNNPKEQPNNPLLTEEGIERLTSNSC